MKNDSLMQYPEFRKLLRKAIGARSQAQFANESGISPEHLNRILNMEAIHRPTKSTLLKMSSVAKNGITYQMFEDALDMDDNRNPRNRNRMKLLNDVGKDIKKKIKNDIRNDMEEAMIGLKQVIDNFKYPVIVPSFAVHMEEIMKRVIENMPDKRIPTLSYDIKDGYPYLGYRHLCGSNFVEVSLCMADRFNTASSQMILYYTEIPSRDGTKKYAIQDASCCVGDVFELFGLPGECLFPIPDEDVEKQGVPMEAPFYYVIEPIARFLEKYQGKGDTNEEKLITQIFGEENTYPIIKEGIGFWMPEDAIPEGYVSFIFKHKETVLSPYEDEKENYEKALELLTEAQEINNPRKFIEFLDQNFYRDDNAESDSGWQASIAVVMERETGFPFRYYAKTEDEEGKYDFLSNSGCVIITKEELEKMGEADSPFLPAMRETVLLTVLKYARELRLDKFGDIMYAGLETTYTKPMTYMVKYDEDSDDKNISSLPSLDTLEYSIELESGEKPNEDGLFGVKFHDGRLMYMVYISKMGHWIKKQREWSDMIEAYCPTNFKNIALQIED